MNRVDACHQGYASVWRAPHRRDGGLRFGAGHARRAIGRESRHGLRRSRRGAADCGQFAMGARRDAHPIGPDDREIDHSVLHQMAAGVIDDVTKPRTLKQKARAFLRWRKRNAQKVQ